MAREALVSDSVDPLSGLNGPSLFPRTIRASADVPVPADSKDLDSIHNFMKSLKELRSPEKLMNEAKKIVDGGAELLESNLASFAENVSVTNAITAKGKDKPQDRRPGLGRARKRAPFSLKTSIREPSASLEQTFNIDHLQDPDEFFDAYERIENAKKEIQKQLGGSLDNLNLYKPSNNERRRRPGILGRSYNYKHRYSSTPSENDDMWMSSQETVYQDIPSATKDESQEKLVHPDTNPDADLEEVELAVSVKKTENEVSDILEELLSCNDEDLEGHGALNILQERLKIKPLDLENLYMTELPDVGRTNILTASGSWQKPRKSSVVIDSVMKNLNRKPHMEQELVANPVNPVALPTPPRSPFASISLLKKRILQPPSPLRDPFSPLNIDLSARPNASPAQSKDRLLGLVDAPQDLGMSSELESHVEVGNTEPPISNMDAQEVMRNVDSLPEQFVDENASIQRTNADSRPNASPAPPKDKLLGQVDELNDLGMSSELESHVEVGNTEPPTSNMDAQEVMRNADSLPEQFVDKNASIQRTNADSRPNASPAQPNDKLLGQVDKLKDLGMPSELESHVQVGNTEPTISNMDGQEVMRNQDSLPEQFVDENASIQSTNANSRPNDESDNNIGKTMNVNEKEARDDTSSRKQIDPEQQPEFQVHAAKLLRGKRLAGEKRIRNAHPMRKSLAEAGTSFETGVRRSKRIKMRPLEYWKGERFLYGRVENSLKLIGVKYISPEKGNENLKVKPYIFSELPEFKELLDLAARH